MAVHDAGENGRSGGRRFPAGPWAALAALCLLLSSGAWAQGYYGTRDLGTTEDHTAQAVLQKVGLDQRLNQPLPLDATFRDETGRTVRLGDYFGKRPAILALVYYQCPMLCTQELNGLTGALDMLQLTPGRDFDVLAVSFDPNDTPALAQAKKAVYLKRYHRPGTDAGWHFLTGTQPNIDALTRAAGFRYTRVPGPDGRPNQFAHTSAVMVVTPDGRLAQYYYGIEYSPKDLRLGLVEASHNRIGTVADQLILLCFHYDPATGKYSYRVVRIVQLAGLLTVLGLGSFMFVMFRRDVREAHHAADPDPDPKTGR